MRLRTRMVAVGAVAGGENHSKSSVIEDPNAPFLTSLAHRYAMADMYFGVTHPSMPNYLAAIAGDNFGLHDDNDQNVVNVDRANLVDQLEAHHIRPVFAGHG
ncbi:MAG: hypothetical protein J2P16_09655 [Mycobacterium sp.]|nr:hypothetical protein [Mycobacterium sp.]